MNEAPAENLFCKINKRTNSTFNHFRKGQIQKFVDYGKRADRPATLEKYMQAQKQNMQL